MKNSPFQILTGTSQHSPDHDIDGEAIPCHAEYGMGYDENRSPDPSINLCVFLETPFPLFSSIL